MRTIGSPPIPPAPYAYSVVSITGLALASNAAHLAARAIEAVVASIGRSIVGKIVMRKLRMRIYRRPVKVTRTQQLCEYDTGFKAIEDIEGTRTGVLFVNATIPDKIRM